MLRHVPPGALHDQLELVRPELRDDPHNGAFSADDGDEVVAQLRAIWQEVLQVDAIGPHDDLFDLGGHSLIITRINGRVRQQFGVELPLDVYFDTPTVAEIADVLRESIGGVR